MASEKIFESMNVRMYRLDPKEHWIEAARGKIQIWKIPIEHGLFKYV
jgi:hypothetical protein